jgi:Zn-dependent protease with chaperone function/Flp pilus assembly protein TadD
MCRGSRQQLASILLAPIIATVLTGRFVHAQSPGTAVGGAASADQVQELLRREPISLENWPTWRGRLVEWSNDRGDATTPAYHAAWEFLERLAGADGELPNALADDALAWYLLGSAYISSVDRNGNEETAEFARAEKALRRSIELDPTLSRAHARLAQVLIRNAPATAPDGARTGAGRIRLDEARREIDEARRLDPALPWIAAVEGELALAEDRFDAAEPLFEQAMKEYPENAYFAQAVALCIVRNNRHVGNRAASIDRLLAKFPDDGVLVAFHAVALAQDGDVKAADRELRRARKLGTDPSTIIGAETVTAIEQHAAPSLVERFTWAMIYFAGIYGVEIACMALVGVLLAGWTRGTRALKLLSDEPAQLVLGGQVIRASGETGLAKLYAFFLVIGLVLFYVAIPFVVAGLLGGTLLLLYLIFRLGRIPVKLVLIVVIVGLGGVWAVLKSLFARPNSGSFGLRKTAAECPRLFAALAEVARRVDTRPVDEVYLAPGSAIGVHQEGRGPFGIFGVSKRVLTLGLSTLSFLTKGELYAILSHEYAHFSHRDTFFSRFIYQVMLSIERAVEGMGQTGGGWNYVNPFYWFLILYYRAYTLLAAGFSRSREFLADRMACMLYGSDVFGGALAKVSTDGVLFEATIYQNISHLLDKEQMFHNMYEAFRDYRSDEAGAGAREELTQQLRNEKPSLFSTHPTFRERIEAAASLPRAIETDKSPARELFNDPAKLEEELTEFLTHFMNYMRQAQSAAAQNT